LRFLDVELVLGLKEVVFNILYEVLGTLLIKCAPKIFDVWMVFELKLTLFSNISGYGLIFE